jgi:hypothetical protein
MRQEPEFFGNAELDLVFVARRLRDALKLEGILSDFGLDYLVETDTYLGGFLFKRELTGAFFYVAPGDAEKTRGIMRDAGMKVYLGSG